MSHNPIIDEIHEIRQQLAARLGNDIHAIGDWARQRDAEDDRPVMRLPPRRPAGWSENATDSAATQDNIMPSEQTQRKLLAALARLRQIHPHWRLGEAMANVAIAAGRTSANGVWNLEDDEALAAARTLIEQYSEIGSDVD